MEQKHKTILSILLERNRLTHTEAGYFDEGLSNEKIEEKLRKDNLVSSDDIAKAYSILYDLPLINLQNLNVPPDVYNLISKDLICKYQLIAFAKEGNIPGGKIKIAIGSPANLNIDKESVIDHLKKTKNITTELYITTPEDLKMVENRINAISVAPVEPQTPVQVEPKIIAKPTEIHEITKQNVFTPPVGLKTIDLRTNKIPYEVITKFPMEISVKYNMVVFDNPTPSLIKVAVSDPYNNQVREILDFVKQKNEIAIEEFVASPSEIRDAINLYYKKPEPPKPAPSPAFPPKPKIADTSIEIPSPKIQAAPNKITDFKPKPIPISSSPANPQANPPTTAALGDPNVLKPQPNTAAIPQQKQPEQPKEIPHPQFTQQPNPQVAHEPHKETIEEEFQRPLEDDLDKFIGKTIEHTEDLKQIAATGNVPQILAALVALAAFKKASDIHVESEEKNVRVRFRIDGILRDIIILPLEIGPAIMSRIKILSRLKIDEQRVPQDGRFDAVTHGHQIDLRVSTLPTVRGEKAAIRILDKTQTIFNLEDLGFNGRNLDLINKNISKPFGIILATGPTGSGKSTTLYAILQKISNPQVNVITLEDPVEYEIPGINQCQVKPKIGFSFAEGLRSVLRQDPNIIMVGEVRDSETAGMATHAALTGHLVLTTLHTNDAAGALPRLMNMGVEPFLITSSINLIIAQRLVRKICQKCKQEARIPEQIMVDIAKNLDKFNIPKPYKFYEAKGCSECDQGYKGRIGIYEVLEMTDSIEDLAVKKRPATEIAQSAINDGMITLKQDGLIKASKAITTVSEVLRVTTND